MKHFMGGARYKTLKTYYLYTELSRSPPPRLDIWPTFRNCQSPPLERALWEMSSLFKHSSVAGGTTTVNAV
jgi:hypothetical protein